MAGRVEIIKRRDQFERNPDSFLKLWDKEEENIRKRMTAARKKLASVKTDDKLLEDATTLCAHLGTDGLRGELTLLRASRAVAALEGKNKVNRAHLKRIAILALQHRLRRNPLDESSSATRVQRALDELFA
jgi:magnesium chelatase subunit I